MRVFGFWAIAYSRVYRLAIILNTYDSSLTQSSNLRGFWAIAILKIPLDATSCTMRKLLKWHNQ